MPRAGRRVLAALAGAALAASCSFDYGEGGAAGGAATLPTAVFEGYSHTVVLRGKPYLELRAARAETWDEEKKTVLSDVEFTEFDADSGERVALGRAESAVFWTQTEDAEFSGSVRLQSLRDDALLEGEYLRWDGKSKRMEGRLDRTVTISRKDGSRASGAGFQADARKRSFGFRGEAEGIMAEQGSAP